MLDGLTTAAETTNRRCDGGYGERMPGATTVISKLQVLILPNASMLSSIPSRCDPDRRRGSVDPRGLIGPHPQQE
jgi:hypothetical protein